MNELRSITVCMCVGMCNWVKNLIYIFNAKMDTKVRKSVTKRLLVATEADPLSSTVLQPLVLHTSQ